MAATVRDVRIEVGGIPLDAVSEPEAVTRVRAALVTGQGGWIVTPNVDHLHRASRDPDLAALIRSADLSVADGAPVVWAARLSGTPLPARVTGADLLWSLSAAAAEDGRSVFLLGGEPGVPEEAAANLKAAYPELKVVGTCSPPFGFEHDPVELDRCREQLLAAAPDIVFVGLGFPKQEHLIVRFARLLPTTWWLGCGAALPFAAGRLDRAPAWMRPVGLEWLYRLGKEPRRLFHRYVLEDAPYAVRLLAGAVRTGLYRRRA